MVTEPKRSRLSRDARRAQLLDSAARLLLEKGAGAVTMERVAEWAGVSKALPYTHFHNSDDVLVALYEQVVTQLGRKVLQAVRDTPADSDRVEAMIHAYFDTVADLGPVLAAVTAPGSPAAQLADGDRRQGSRFVTRLLADQFDLPKERAAAIAPILLASLTGAVSAWVNRSASRAEVERLSILVARTLIEDCG